jgi:hypothetical protein
VPLPYGVVTLMVSLLEATALPMPPLLLAVLRDGVAGGGARAVDLDEVLVTLYVVATLGVGLGEATALIRMPPVFLKSIFVMKVPAAEAARLRSRAPPARGRDLHGRPLEAMENSVKEETYGLPGGNIFTVGGKRCLYPGLRLRVPGGSFPAHHGRQEGQRKSGH